MEEIVSQTNPDLFTPGIGTSSTCSSERKDTQSVRRTILLRQHGELKRRALCDKIGLGPERQEPWSGKERGSKRARTARSGLAALVSEVHGIVPWERNRRVDGAMGRRVGLLTRVQEGLCRMSRVAIQPRNFHTTGRQSLFMCE